MISSWIKSPEGRKYILRSIESASLEYNLTPTLLAAVILTESGGNPLATRHEPDFYRRYLRGKALSEIPGYWPPRVSANTTTEMFLRSTSMGLMQVLGQTARESGFQSDYLVELYDPGLNIPMGAKILASKMKRYGKDGLLRYNGGADEDYPRRVEAKIADGTAAAYLLELESVD